MTKKQAIMKARQRADKTRRVHIVWYRLNQYRPMPLGEVPLGPGWTPTTIRKQPGRKKEVV
jgi:hypothetical protein